MTVMPGRILLALAAVTPCVATAQTRPPAFMDPALVGRRMGELSEMIAQGVFATADANRDGALTRVEAARAASERGLPFSIDPRSWAALDLNRDGVLAQRELADALKGVRARTSMGARPF